MVWKSNSLARLANRCSDICWLRAKAPTREVRVSVYVFGRALTNSKSIVGSVVGGLERSPVTSSTTQSPFLPVKVSVSSTTNFIINFNALYLVCNQDCETESVKDNICHGAGCNE